MRDSNSQWQCLRPLGHQGRPSFVRDSKQSVVMPSTTLLLGLYLSGERQPAVSCNASDHSAIRSGPHLRETASSQWQCLRSLSHQGRPSFVRDSNSQWHRLRPLSHQGRPSFVRDSNSQWHRLRPLCY